MFRVLQNSNRKRKQPAVIMGITPYARLKTIYQLTVWLVTCTPKITSYKVNVILFSHFLDCYLDHTVLFALVLLSVTRLAKFNVAKYYLKWLTMVALNCESVITMMT